MTTTPVSIRGLCRLWRIGPTPAPGALPAGMEPLVHRVLAARGLADAEASREFLAPSLAQLHDPSLIPDLDRAAARLLDAAKGGQPIAIYGDYDVDGITATAILFHTLEAIRPGADVRTYVPHRDEGYGLNAEALTGLVREGVQVIVSVDCGVTAVEPARALRGTGADLIITDHHNPPERMEALPPAYAVVHPRRADSTYPFGELSGAGVAFKLAWRLATMRCGSEKVSPALRALLLELLAFAALGVIADVVPLLGENRVIARFGLGQIKHARFAGLRALVEAAGLAGDEIDADRVGFSLGPRLNACGRMGHAREAVELFTTADGLRAAEIARDLCRKNDDRRRLEKEIFAAACAQAEALGMTGNDRRAIVLAGDDWPKGIIGIVCSRLVERYSRPALLMQRIGDVCHGSGRSVEGFNLHAALAECAGLLLHHGGHDMAAGFALRSEALDRFADSFIQTANAQIPPESLVAHLSVDCDAGMHELTLRAVKQLDGLGPFGCGNPSVRVRLAGVKVADRPGPFGTEARHLAVRISDPRRPGEPPMRLVAWNWGGRAAEISPGAVIDAVVRPKISTWGGQTQVEPELEDVRVR